MLLEDLYHLMKTRQVLAQSVVDTTTQPSSFSTRIYASRPPTTRSSRF